MFSGLVPIFVGTKATHPTLRAIRRWWSEAILQTWLENPQWSISKCHVWLQPLLSWPCTLENHLWMRMFYCHGTGKIEQDPMVSTRKVSSLGYNRHFRILTNGICKDYSLFQKDRKDAYAWLCTACESPNLEWDSANDSLVEHWSSSPSQNPGQFLVKPRNNWPETNKPHFKLEELQNQLCFIKLTYMVFEKKVWLVTL